MSAANASRSRRSRKRPHGQAVRGTPILARRMTRQMLLTGTSLFALVVASPTAHAVQVGMGGGAASSATSAASYAAQQAAQQAQKAAQNAQQALSRATQALQSLQSVQAAARAAAQAASSAVPNGLTAGGLVVDPRVATDPNLWINANQPTQTTNGGQTTVTIQQTASRAVMTWQQFNVGKNTTVDFDQQGNSSWIALNRIDATGTKPDPGQDQGRRHGADHQSEWHYLQWHQPDQRQLADRYVARHRRHGGVERIQRQRGLQSGQPQRPDRLRAAERRCVER